MDGNWSQTRLAEVIQANDARIVLNVAGPYQQHSSRDTPGSVLHIAKSCLLAGADYADLADNPTVVSSVSDLDADAKVQRVTLLSGASTHVALTDAIVRSLVRQMGAEANDVSAITTGSAELNGVGMGSHKCIHRISLLAGITPGWRVPRGVGTSMSILSQCGRLFPRLENGQWVNARGWGQNHIRVFPPPLGRRWQANLNVPDLGVFPRLYPNLRDVRCFAGLESSVFHLGTWLMSHTLGRDGLIPLGTSPLANLLHAATDVTKEWLGTGDGGMYIRVQLCTGAEITWNMVATELRGPLVPCTPAVLVARQSLARALPHGAGACVELLDACDFHKLMDHHGIMHYTS